LDIAKIYEKLEELVGAYEISTNITAKPLWQAIENDFDLINGEQYDSQFYSKSKLDTKNQYIRKDNPLSNVIESWKSFVQSITNSNRFFPSNYYEVIDIFDKVVAENLLDTLIPETVIFRTRIWERDESITPEEMKAPPAEISKSGRANSSGIPALYASSNTQTSILESRPIFGSRVTVAELRTNKYLNIVNLCHQMRIDPFEVLDSDNIDSLLKSLYTREIINEIESHVSEPLFQTDNHSKYAPTQFFCDYVKHKGWDGIKFLSSIDKAGENYVIFDHDSCDVVNVEDYKLSSISVVPDSLDRKFDAADLNSRHHSNRVNFVLDAIRKVTYKKNVNPYLRDIGENNLLSTDDDFQSFYEIIVEKPWIKDSCNTDNFVKPMYERMNREFPSGNQLPERPSEAE
jgi:hypothetical protein